MEGEIINDNVNETEHIKNKAIEEFRNNNECVGRQIFTFENGDIYVGQFKATVKEEVYRQGYGKYFCEDGSIYEGIWNANFLKEGNIYFSNQDKYEGQLNNFKYSGQGTYIMNQVGDIIMVCDAGKPVGSVILVDPHGFNWTGVASVDKNETVLYPVNHFKLTFEDTKNVTDNK